MSKLRLISVEPGNAGVLRRYQHPSLGVLDIVTVWERGAAQSPKSRRAGSADVIYIRRVDVERRRLAAACADLERQRRAAAARSAKRGPLT